MTVFFKRVAGKVVFWTVVEKTGHKVYATRATVEKWMAIYKGALSFVVA